MFKFRWQSSWWLMVLVLLVSCGTTPRNIDNNDAIASSETTSETAQTEVERVVALTSLSADIIHRLDADKLVGIPGSSLLKEDPRFADLPTMNEGRTPPDLEKIVALEPDLVIGAEGFSDKVLARLQELGIQTIATEVDSWESLKEITQTLAKAIAADPQPLLNLYDQYLAESENSQGDASILILASRQPILSPNKNSWAGDFLKQFSANNLAADLQGSSPISGYVTLSPEKIVQADPEIILIIDPAQAEIAEQLKQEPFWQDLQATKSDRVYVFDYYGLVNPGSLAKIEAAAQQLNTIFAEN